jgi:pimeloyl-ACP methyl ester carboxylesterase
MSYFEKLPKVSDDYKRVHEFRSDRAAGKEKDAGSERVPRVAILGVHGVGHHDAGETENAMADLLLALPCGAPNAPREFDSFEAVSLRIPLQPVFSPKKALPTQQSVLQRALNLYQEQSAKFAKAATQFAVTSEAIPLGATGNAYTRMLLQDYEGGADGNYYSTARLEGRRFETGSGGASRVDVYEVLWADLASPNNTILRFFLALFQLLLHLGSLSRLAVETGSAENSGLLWQTYLAVQRYAVRMLQIFIPLFEILFFIVILCSLPSQIWATKMGILIPVALGSLTGSVVSILLLTRKNKPVTGSPWLWALLALVPGVVGAGLGALAFQWLKGPGVAGALACWVCLGVPLLYYILSMYESVRKGVQITGWIAYVVCFVTFAVLLGQGHNVPEASLWMAELVAAAVRVSWLLLTAFALLALPLGSLLCLRAKNGSKRARLRAAVRTSRFALALPSVLFLLITTTIWCGIFALTSKMKLSINSVDERVALTWHVSKFANFHLIPNLKYQLPISGDYLASLLRWNLSPQLPITLGLFATAIFLLIWWALPSALTERYPLRNEQVPPRNSTNTKTLRMGTWLSRGLDATSTVTFLLWSSVFLTPIVVYCLSLHWRSILSESVKWLLLAAPSGALLAIIVKYGSPVLGVILDVDTYLRTSPDKETPRAKIFERYASTLRYLAQFRDEDGHGYDSVVIVAHSLGSLITADLLLFLRDQGDPELAAFGLAGNQEQGSISVQLLTMGSPIRQLLNRFFPYLYDWARSEPDNSLHPLPAPTMVPPPTIAVAALPNPKHFALTKWVNVYRSGDYVGRSLWLDEWYFRTDPKLNNGRYPNPIHVATNDTCSEMCIGAGAHTHYWDDTAPDVAETLNSLI